MRLREGLHRVGPLNSGLASFWGRDPRSGKGRPRRTHQRPAEARPRHDLPDPRVAGSECSGCDCAPFQVRRSGWVEQEMFQAGRSKRASASQCSALVTGVAG